MSFRPNDRLWLKELQQRVIEWGLDPSLSSIPVCEHTHLPKLQTHTHHTQRNRIRRNLECKAKKRRWKRRGKKRRKRRKRRERNALWLKPALEKHISCLSSTLPV